MLALPLAILTPASPARAASPDVLPDLVAHPPTNAKPPRVAQLADGQNHLLLAFSGSLHNAGAGALEIRGSIPVNGVMTVTGQRIYRQDSTYYDDNSRRPRIEYETTDAHDHWHFKSAARFSLWNEAGTAEVAPAAKVGFCLEDGEPYDSFATPTPAYTASQTLRCNEGQPNATQTFQGISTGWLDVYGSNVPFQWVDISDVPPGNYRLASEMDPEGFVLEGSEANNGPALATATVAVPGYVAVPSTLTATGATTVTLSVATYGSPGSQQLTIGSWPRHGRLSSPAGAALAGSQVVYTPDPGFVGSDAFAFTARDASSPFPLHAAPPAATVTVSVPAPPRRRALLARLRFWRDGRFLLVRGRVRRTGVLRILIKRGKRVIGSCRKRVPAPGRFTCRAKLRKHASLVRAKGVATLLVNGKPSEVSTFRVPRHIRQR